MKMNSRTFVMIIVIVIVIAFGTSQINTTSKQKVEVSGNVFTIGLGTQPIRIDFEPTTGKPSSVTVEANHYLIELNAPESYKIKVTYSASDITTSTCEAGTLNLDTSQNPRPYDIKC